MKEILIEESNV